MSENQARSRLVDIKGQRCCVFDSDERVGFSPFFRSPRDFVAAREWMAEMRRLEGDLEGMETIGSFEDIPLIERTFRSFEHSMGEGYAARAMFQVLDVIWDEAKMIELLNRESIFRRKFIYASDNRFWGTGIDSIDDTIAAGGIWPGKNMYGELLTSMAIIIWMRSPGKAAILNTLTFRSIFSSK